MKAQTALQEAQEVAARHSHQELVPLHLLVALLGQADGVVRPLLTKLGARPEELAQEAERWLASQPKVHRMTQHFLGSALQQVLEDALHEADQFKVDLQLMHLRRQLSERKIEIELTEPARELLFRAGYDTAYGARPLKRALQPLIQDPLALKILNGEVLPGERVVVDADPAGRDEMKFVWADTAVAAR